MSFEASGVLSEEEVRKITQQAAEGYEHLKQERVARREQVMTVEYAQWLKGFAATHKFVGESGYGVRIGTHDGTAVDIGDHEDKEKIESILDFIEFALSYCSEKDIDATATDEYFPTQEVEVVIDQSVVTLGRVHGQGVLYYLEGFDDAAISGKARINAEDVIRST